MIGWKKNEFEHKFTMTPILAPKNGQNHVFEIYIWSSIYTVRTTHKMCSLLGRRSTSFGANYFQNQGIHSILRIQKRPYRDVKMKKMEEIWRENAVGIGLCNECVLWWGVRFERLLAALKSKRHIQAQSCFVFGASVLWAFGMINA